MSGPGLWARLKKARVVQVLIAYLVASWVVLQVAEVLQESLALPAWVLPTAVLLLLVGLVIILATAWVQAHPHTEHRELSGEVPTSWAIAPKDLGKSLKAGRLPHLTWGRSILGGVFALWFLFGLAGLYVIIRDRGESFTPPEAVAGEAGEGIAIVPFTVTGPELEVWREGMVDLFSTSLDGVGGYRTIDSRTVMARWREVVGGVQQVPDLATTLGVARRSGARYVLTGSAVAIGDNVRLAADIYDVPTGTKVGQGQVEGSSDDVLELVDRLTVAVMGDLFREGDSELLSQHQAASVTTSSLPALKAYLEGEAYYRKADFFEAIESFERAVEEDTTFALAYYRLSDAYGWIDGIESERAREHIETAARLSERLRPRDQLILRGTRALIGGDLSGVESHEEAARKYPDDPEAWFGLGEWYVHYGGELLAENSEVDRVLSRAVELDPTFAPYYIHLIEATIIGRDTVRASELLDAYLGLAPAGEEAESLSIAVPLFLGDSASRAAARARLSEASDDVLQRINFNIDWAGGQPWVMEEIARELRERNGGWGFRIAAALGAQGKADALMEGAGQAPPVGRVNDLFLLQYAVLPPDAGEDLLAESDLAVCGVGENLSVFCVMQLGTADADAGRWPGHAKAIDLLRRRAEALDIESDSARIALAELGVTWLEARESWRRGRPDEALALLREAQGKHPGVDGFVRWGLAELYAAEGQPREAVRYFESLLRTPIYSYSRYRLCELYGELGETEKAKVACEAFLVAWQDADSDLPQPAEAREILGRIWSEPPAAEVPASG